MRERWLPATGLILLGLVATSCSQEQDLIRFWAGTSLAPLASEVSLRFEQNNPSVRVEVTALPDLEAIARIRAGEAPPDLLGVADSRLLEKLLSPRLVREYQLLAGDEIVLAAARDDLWRGDSELFDWRQNWVQLVFQAGLRVAGTDPGRDALGYFTRLSWKLAEIHYDRQGLYQRFLREGRDQAGHDGRPGELEELIAGSSDLAFVFLSTALQNDLRHLRFPPQVSLGSNAHEEIYARVFERIPGQGPGFPLEVPGHSIRYAVARLGEEDRWATLLEEFLGSRESQNLFRAMGYRDAPFERVRIVLTPE